MGVRSQSLQPNGGRWSMSFDDKPIEAFRKFVAGNEAGLRHALTAALGAELGREAAAEALAYGWESWDRVAAMDNAAGYLYRVGLNWGRKRSRRRPVSLPELSTPGVPWIEPGLSLALAQLSDKQRTAIYLVHGHEWSLAEVAELLGVAKGTVQTHLERGMQRLRRELGVEV